MTMSAYMSTAVINTHLRTGTRYLALFEVMPARDGTGGTEVAGGSYARQVIVFDVDTDGLTMNIGLSEFSNMPECDLVGGGVYDAASGGNLLTFGYFSSPRHISAGIDFTVLPGDVVEVIR
jgi:hypothetical protein